jgi:hypothetical protein
MSPNDHDRIWEPSGLEDLTGERTAGEIADRVLGTGLLRELDPERQSVTSQVAWNENERTPES